MRLSAVRRGRLSRPLPSTAARWTTWSDGHAHDRSTVYARTRSESRLDRWPPRRLGVAENAHHHVILDESSRMPMDRAL